MSSKEEDENSNSDRSHNPESAMDLDRDELVTSDPASEKQHNDEYEKFRKFIDVRPSIQVVDFETFRKDDKSGWPEVVKTTYLGHIDPEDDGKRSRESRWIIEGKHRFVALMWPRNPNGEFMTLQHSYMGKYMGKSTPNGVERWGATLYDFYMVNRVPSADVLQTIATGSALAAWCKQNGELDWAKPELMRAELEMNPRQIHVFDIGKYLEELENQVAKGRVGKSMRVNRSDTKIGTQFLYPPSEYPAPWPLRPFSVPLARLQRKYPHSVLPKLLVVHDPWNVLLTGNDGRRPIARSQCKWGSKADNIRVYHLELSTNPGNTSSVSAKEGNEEKSGSSSNAKQEEIEEESDYKLNVAHLYLSPGRRVGEGHHSFVYQAELELPRDLLVRPKACWRCLMNRYTRLKTSISNGTSDSEHGDWLMNATDAETEAQYRRVCESELDEEEDARKIEMLNALGEWQTEPPYCEHLHRDVPIPPSHRVSVTAKLCLPGQRDGDNHKRHLANEAKCYQEFPSHMFEHWNGYNIIPPMHEPTPVGAVVPQFYGYYVPDQGNLPLKRGFFMSPILLLEHCGVQVDPRKLLTDDRHECFSLIRRLHYAGYIHNSSYKRNFVMQYGPLQESPLKRSKDHMRFRLIDFGRTRAAGPDEHYSKPSGTLLSKEMRNAAEDFGINSYSNF